MLTNDAVSRIFRSKVLITGASGSVGKALQEALSGSCFVVPTDEDTMDVTDFAEVSCVVDEVEPSVIFHLAGAKHAPAGEEDPWYALQVNAVGTRNVLTAAEAVPDGCRVVLASTCKACNPETAYGASKLLAERMTLNAGQSVARFFNVVETQGNVFDIWARTPPDGPILWTDCWRYFVSIREAIGLLVWAAVLPPARYALDPGDPRWMGDVARESYPGRNFLQMPVRRGDRLREPLKGAHEHGAPADGAPAAVRRVVSPHD